MKSPIQVHKYIQLIVEEHLSMDDTKLWYHCVKNFGPVGVMSSIADISNGVPTTTCLISRNIGDKWYYIVPLTRDLLEEEAGKIVEAFSKIYEGDFDIQISSGLAKVPEKETSIMIKQQPFFDLCDTWAKRRHHSWCNRMVSQGWRCGDEYDLEGKIHPALKPWEQLKTSEKDIDHNEPQSFIDMLFQNGYAITRPDA